MNTKTQTYRQVPTFSGLEAPHVGCQHTGCANGSLKVANRLEATHPDCTHPSCPTASLESTRRLEA